MITVAIIDDHPIVREGIASALGDEADLQIVGSAGSAEEALTLLARLKPNVVLLDLELPGMSGIEAIPALREASPASNLLVFTAYDTDERVLGAIRLGVNGYLLKGTSTAEIASAVRAVAAGETALTPRVANKLMSAMSSPRGAGQPTHREREVLRLIAEGLPSKQIALSLGISERTVKFHTTSLLRKLGADNRAQAVALAARRGLLEPEQGTFQHLPG